MFTNPPGWEIKELAGDSPIEFGRPVQSEFGKGWWWVPASVIEGVIADAVITGSGGPGDVVAGAFDEAGDGDPAGED
jgi:hypothetical protein